MKRTLTSSNTLLLSTALILFSITSSIAQWNLSLVKTNVTCNGNANGSIDLTVNGGSAPYSYSWSNGSTNEDLSGLSGGIYTVIVTDAGGQSLTGSETVVEPAALTVSIVPQPAPCGSNIGFATANPAGGTPKKVPTNPTYFYLWSDGRTTKSIGGLYPGTYTVTVTDSVGCVTTQSTVIANTAIVDAITSSVKARCNQSNGSACVDSVIGGIPPFTYSWSTVPVQTTSCATGLAKGKYYVNIVAADGCLHIEEVKVGWFKPLGGYVKYQDCNTAKVQSINGIYPFSYIWSNGQTTKTATGLSDGTYTATITDGNGCTSTVEVIISCASRSGISTTESAEEISIVPNPAENDFDILFESATTEKATISLFDLSGKLVLSKQVDVVTGDNTINIEIAGLPSGIYTVSFTTSQTTLFKKLVRK